MVLSFISRDRQALRLMSNRASNLLKAYYGGIGPVSETKTLLAERVFAWMKTDEYFLVCDCERTRDAQQLPPTLDEARVSPLRTAALPGIMRALPQPYNIGHHADCIFAQQRAKASNVVPRLERPDRTDLAVFGPYPNIPVDRNNLDRPQGENRPRLPSISQVLFSIIEAAGLNTIDATRTSGPPALEAYLQSDQLFLVPGFSLKNALVTGDRSDEDTGVRRIIFLKKRIASPARWPEGLRPQGFWCGVVSGYRADAEQHRYDVSVKGWKKPQYIETRPHVFGGYTHGGAREPYIAIFGYALRDQDADRALGIRSFMQPCFDDNCWFPVDSNYERKTLKILIDIQRSHPHYNIVIHKPLFNVPVDQNNNAYCKADFVLNFTRDGKRFEVAIETMGYTDDDYEERKGRTHPLMFRLYGGLIQHSMSPGRNAELQRLFRAELLAFIERGEQPSYSTLQPS